MKTNILLVDNHQILIDSLRLLIQQHPDLEVAGEANDGRSAVEMSKKLSPHVIVMDIKMPDFNGIEATKQILVDNPEIKIIALSVSDDIVYIREMMAAGALGYLLKESSGDELVDAIITVAGGERYVSKAINSVILDDYQQNLNRSDKPSPQPLSAREIEIVKLLALGFNSKKIAAELNIAVKTVDAHRRNTMDKLNIFNLAGLTKYAIRNGLISLNDE